MTSSILVKESIDLVKMDKNIVKSTKESFLQISATFLGEKRVKSDDIMTKIIMTKISSNLGQIDEGDIFKDQTNEIPCHFH